MFLRAIAFLATIMTTPSLAGELRVVTDIAPVNDLVADVMQGIGEPRALVPPSASVHSYDLRPSAASALENADIVIWMGEALTPWLADPVATLASGATVIELMDVPGTTLLPFREEEGFGHEDDEHEAGHDAHEGADPHAWLDPDNALLWLEVIAAALAEADPDNAARYRANAGAGQAAITDAVQAAEAELQEPNSLKFAVYHDAYQYFERRFGLSPVGAVTLGDAAAPGPAHIQSLQRQLSETGTDCLLVEPQEAGRLVGAFTGSSALRIVEIDPFGAATGNDATHYPRLISSLAASFAACR